MGWSGGTELFDQMVKVGLDLYTRVPWEGLEHSPENIAYVVSKVYPIFEYGDWDTQDESEFWPYLRNEMIRLGEIDPDD